MQRRNETRRGRQGGVAIVLALLLTALAVTVVSSLFWPQQVQVRQIENQYQQAQARAALASAQAEALQLLRLDALEFGFVTVLNGAWARPVAPIDLARYLTLPTGEGPPSVLHTRISDAQARFNLRNLAENGKPAPSQVAVLRRLLSILRLDQSLAERAAAALAHTQVGVQAEPSGRPVAAGLADLADLHMVPGFTPAVIAALRPHVVLLPRSTLVNANTAGEPVLAAAGGITPAQAASLARSRRQAYLRDVGDIALRLNQERTLVEGRWDVGSNYFVVEHWVRFGRTELAIEALVERRAAGRGGDDSGQALPTTVVWQRRL